MELSALSTIASPASMDILIIADSGMACLFAMTLIRVANGPSALNPNEVDA